MWGLPCEYPGMDAWFYIGAALRLATAALFGAFAWRMPALLPYCSRGANALRLVECQTSASRCPAPCFRSWSQASARPCPRGS